VTARLPIGVPAPRASRPTAELVPVGRYDVHELGAGQVEALVYRRDTLPAGHRVTGPSVIQQADSTTWLPSYAGAEVHPSGALVVTIAPE
jgi:N-methylhydantoinase A